MLVKTGLWQGPWRLFGPDVDRQNMRLAAEVAFADGAVAKWESPEWNDTSAWTQFVHARQTNYFNNILKPGDASLAPAWVGLCAYLARTVPHPTGAVGVRVAQITLLVRVAQVPEPGDPLISSSPYERYGEPVPMITWRPPS